MTEYIRDKILEKAGSIIREEDLNTLDHFNLCPRKKLVYTSFDGDYMHYLCDMQEFVMRQQMIPINPEAALGYFVSTSSHGDSKIPVMIDCIITELLCDCMWVFNPQSGYIPEGIMAEMMVWGRKKGTEIRFFNFFPNELSKIKDTQEIPSLVLAHNEIETYIENHWSEKEIDEITNGLLQEYERAHPQAVYIVANFYNYKHIDWARRYCYLNMLCPVCVQTLLPFYLYQKLGNGSYQEYLQDRLTILDRLGQIVVFLNTKQIEQEIERLDYYSICELYYAINHKSEGKIQIVGWDEAGVPKYLNSEKWALTEKEREEVI